MQNILEEKTKNVRMLEHADGFDDSSLLVPSSSSLLREVEQIGSYMDDLLLVKE